MAYYHTRDGCSLYYETIGFELARPVVVFLNGTLQTTMYWKVIAAALKPELRALLYDARGQGASDLGDLPLTLDLHLEDLLGLMEHLALGPVCMVGLSHGALLGYAMARRRPQAVSRLVMLAIGAGRTMRSRLIVRSWATILEAAGLEALVAAVLPHVFGERYLAANTKVLERVAKAIVRRNRQAAVAAHLAAMARYPGLRSMLGPVAAPLLVMCGSDDPLVSVRGAIELADKSGGRHLVVDAAGHSIPVEEPKRFVETIAPFLSGRWVDMPEGH